MKSLKELVNEAKVIKRNLPIQHYKILHSFYSEDYCTCSNCNKVLKNVAVVEGDDKKQYPVGLDCAATLSGINDHDIAYWDDAFKIAKQYRTKFIKKCKEHGKENVRAYVFNTSNDRNKFIVVNWYKPNAEIFDCSDKNSVETLMISDMSLENVSKFLPEIANICLYNEKPKRYDEDKDLDKVPESGKKMDGYTIEYGLEEYKNWKDHYHAYAKIYDGSKLIQSNGNGGNNIDSAKKELLRILNSALYAKTAKLLSEVYVVDREEFINKK